MGSRQDNRKQKLIEQLAQAPIVQVACQRSGVSRATYYRWRDEDIQFAADCDEAREQGVGLVNDMAESQVIKGIQEGKSSHIMFWLRNRHPSYTQSRSHTDYAAAEEYRHNMEETRRKIRDFLDDKEDIVEDVLGDEPKLV